MSLHLSKLSFFKGRPGPLLLIIMDGVGIGKPVESNAVYMAQKPHLDALFKSSLYTQLKAHGTAVGMPSDEDMGNSEVGHNALGSGRIFDQGASLVQKAIDSGALFNGDTWKAALAHCKTHQSTLHFIGLLSDGNVHAHIRHLIEMLKKAALEVPKIRIHTLLDGRDVSQKSALIYLNQLELVMSELNQAGADIAIASGGGRMVTTMDRYNADWSIVKRGWDAHVLGEARFFTSAKEAVETFYRENPAATDQYLPAFVIVDADKHPLGPIVDGDGVLFFNFRGDRAIELSQAFEQESFSKFDRVRIPKVFFAGMMQYDGDLKIPAHFLVQPPQIDHPLSEYLCAEHVTSFALSETQKFGHVTYFWNGNRSGYVNHELETYIEIESDRVPFDQAPAMKAFEITERAIELLESGSYKFGRINFPNGDMVGHTGVMDAAVKACEVTDACVGRLVETVNRLNGITVILADHGNVDEMFTIQGGQRIPKTAHTLNPVPFVIVDPLYQNEYQLASVSEPGLANVAATLCNLLGYQAPSSYEESLIC